MKNFYSLALDPNHFKMLKALCLRFGLWGHGQYFWVYNKSKVYLKMINCVPVRSWRGYIGLDKHGCFLWKTAPLLSLGHILYCSLMKWIGLSCSTTHNLWTVGPRSHGGFWHTIWCGKWAFSTRKSASNLHNLRIPLILIGIRISAFFARIIFRMRF